MKTVLVEFPVVGYAEVEIEVEDDMLADDILDAILDNDIEVTYDGHSHVGTLTPMLDLRDWPNFENDFPPEIGVVE